MTKGRFITLEGGEGVGKSTNLHFIKDFLLQRDIPVITTREPGGTELAEHIRQLLLNKHQETLMGKAELLLMFAARAQHLKQLILPALAQGQWVVSDRFTDATYAYQGGGRKMDSSSIAWLENFIQRDFRPDLTFLLDAPVETGLKRASARSVPDRFESEKQTFFHNVRQRYLDIARQQPERVKIINANRDLVAVQLQISDCLKVLTG